MQKFFDLERIDAKKRVRWGERTKDFNEIYKILFRIISPIRTKGIPGTKSLA